MTANKNDFHNDIQERLGIRSPWNFVFKKSRDIGALMTNICRETLEPETSIQRTGLLVQ